jgi:hypothetical protein
MLPVLSDRLHRGGQDEVAYRIIERALPVLSGRLYCGLTYAMFR